MHSIKNFAVIVAGGKGLRMASKTKKQYLCLNGVPILSHALKVFEQSNQIHEIILVIPKGDTEYCKEHIIDSSGFTKKIKLVEGGATRQESVLNGLKQLNTRTNLSNETIVLIHDGVRPFVDNKIIENCITNAFKYGACIPAINITDTVKQVRSDLSIQKTLNRELLYTAQTPQAFKLELIIHAYEHALKSAFVGTCLYTHLTLPTNREV
mgnify:CR=1 FL=1